MQTSKARMLRYLSPERAKLAWHFRRMANYAAETYKDYPREPPEIFSSWIQCCYTPYGDKAMALLMKETLDRGHNQNRTGLSGLVLLCLFLELAIMDGTIDP